MQITHCALSLFAAAAAAQSSSSNSTDLSSTVAQLPKCALKCYRDQSNDVGCSPGDFSCICGPKRQDFLKGIAVCLTLGSSCSSDDLNSTFLSYIVSHVVWHIASSNDALLTLPYYQNYKIWPPKFARASPTTLLRLRSPKPQRP